MRYVSLTNKRKKGGVICGEAEPDRNADKEGGDDTAADGTGGGEAAAAEVGGDAVAIGGNEAVNANAQTSELVQVFDVVDADNQESELLPQMAFQDADDDY